MIRYLVLVLACCAAAIAQTTHLCDSVSWEDFDDKYQIAFDGDTIQLPPGDVAWMKTHVITKGITIQGAGEGVTIIRDSIRKANTTNDAQAEAVFALNIQQPKVFRLTDISILPGSPADYTNGIIQFRGSCKAYVLQRVTISTTTNPILHSHYGSAVYGVIAECTLSVTNGPKHVARWAHSSHAGPTGSRINGNGSWESPRNAGTDQFFYLEDNVLTGTPMATSTINITDGFGGARYANRFNVCINKGFGHHGTESSAQYRAPVFTESYCNTFSRALANSEGEVFDFRDGSGYVWGNSVTGTFTNWIKLNSYRHNTHFRPWGPADGTMLWDENDISDDASTPGPENVGTGEADGVFEGGTAAASAANTVVCTGKTWDINQWRYYAARVGSTFTATSGTATSVTVSGAGWNSNEWAGWYITRKDNNQKGYVASNTADTITLSTEMYRPSFTGYTGQLQLTRGTTILSNTADTLSLASWNGSIITPKIGQWVEIRRVTRLLDQTGRGQSTLLSPGTSIATSPHQSLGTVVDPAYFWLNNFKGNSYVSIGTQRHHLQVDRDFFNHKSDFNSSPDSGIGAGPIASRPASGGLLNVAYWATDEGDWNQGISGTIAVTSLDARQWCEIVSAGTTDFTAIGAPNNTVGTQFVSTGVGTGTGTVKAAQGQLYRWNGSAWYLAYEPYEYPHPLRDDGATPIPDTTPPEVQSIAVNGATVTVTLNEPCVGGAAGQFTFSGGALSSFSGTSSSATRTMTTTPSAVFGGAYFASYTAGDIEDAAGNPLDSFVDFPVTNNTANADVTPPTVTSAVVNGDALVVIYDEPVVGVVAGDYSMSGGRTLSNPTGTGNSRSFTVSPPAVHGATYTRTYVAGTTADAAGNLMVGFSAQAITNSTPEPEPTYEKNPGKKKGKGRVFAP